VGRYSVSLLAGQDVLDIIGYVSTRNIGAADRLRDRLIAAFARLAARPSIGHPRHDLAPRAMDLRFWPVGRYLVIYRTIDGGIEIVRVFSAYRDISALLNEATEE
jgi:toxin ParE1/3/4